MIFKDLFINFSTSCVWLRLQTEEALFTTLKITYVTHDRLLHLNGDSTSLCLGIIVG